MKRPTSFVHRIISSGLAAALACAPATLTGQARSTPDLPSAPSANLGTALPPVAVPRIYPELKPYESCSFPDGLQITDVTAMPGDVRDRPVQSHGVTRQVPLLAGRRITFAYPGAKPYASAKVELLPTQSWLANRKLLLDDFDDIANSDKTVARNKTRQPTISSFSIVGLDRMALLGNTLGIYMLLDDKTHVATTLYFLNPPESRFKGVADYTHSRDTFLYNYTHCIRSNQSGAMFGGAK